MPADCNSIFSVDVEDWFHILDVPSAPAITDWGQMPSRVESNFRRLLALFSEARVQVTCFFLGWIAERYPQLVREAVNLGHEIASHGYSHQLAYRTSPSDFHNDARHSRILLEQISGQAVLGYRASGFSATAQTPWFFDEVARAGYQYDSSLFPMSRGHGGNSNGLLEPHRVADGALLEIPISVAELGFARICAFGGGYLRVFPYPAIRNLAQRVLAAGRPVVFYVHPRDIDPGQPRLAMPWRRRFKTYVNLRTTEGKIRSIMRDFRVTTFRDYLRTLTRPGGAALPATTAR